MPMQADGGTADLTIEEPHYHKSTLEDLDVALENPNERLDDEALPPFPFPPPSRCRSQLRVDINRVRLPDSRKSCTSRVSDCLDQCFQTWFSRSHRRSTFLLLPSFCSQNKRGLPVGLQGLDWETMP